EGTAVHLRRLVRSSGSLETRTRPAEAVPGTRRRSHESGLDRFAAGAPQKPNRDHSRCASNGPVLLSDQATSTLRSPRRLVSASVVEPLVPQNHMGTAHPLHELQRTLEHVCPS